MHRADPPGYGYGGRVCGYRTGRPYRGRLLGYAINEGVKDGYVSGYLRKSVVNDPIFERKNMANNALAVINVRLTRGEKSA